MSHKVPKGWKSGLFTSFITLQRGHDLPLQDRVGGAFPIIASNGPIGFHNDYRVGGPAVVTGRSGTIGNVFYNEGPCWPLNTSLYVSNFHGNYPKYIYYFLHNFGLNRLSTGTDVPTLNRNDVHSKCIIFPSLSEQRCIAEIMSSMDEATAATKAVIEQVRVVKQSVLKRLLTKGIGHTRFKLIEIGEIPRTWKMVSLQTVATVQTGLAKGAKKVEDGIEVPYLRVANVQDGYLDLSELKTVSVERSWVSRYCLRAGDVLLTEGGDFDKLGRGTVWRGQVDLCLHQNHVFAVRPNQNVLLSDFLAALTGSDYGKKYFRSCAKRTTNLASINSTQVKNFPILLPPLEEQAAITDQLAALQAMEERSSECLRQLEQLKSALLSDLLSGRKRVPMAEHAPLGSRLNQVQ